jgi:hypothetical protein
MSQTEPGIKWDAQQQILAGWVDIEGKRVRVCIPRDLIHSIPIYRDITEREIEQLKWDIVERLKHSLSIASPD